MDWLECIYMPYMFVWYMSGNDVCAGEWLASKLLPPQTAGIYWPCILPSNTIIPFLKFIYSTSLREQDETSTSSSRWSMLHPPHVNGLLYNSGMDIDNNSNDSKQVFGMPKYLLTNVFVYQRDREMRLDWDVIVGTFDM